MVAAFFGEAANRLGSLANKYYVMLHDCTYVWGPKFIVKMLPVAKLDTTFLMEQTKLILEMLKKSLANPMAIVCEVIE